MQPIIGKSILVVDDEADLREIFTDAFSMVGATVEQAGNGQEALALLRTRRYDCVVTDVRMPGGNGIELLANIRAQLSQTLPVYLVSGFSDIDSREAFDQGADGVVSKPFDFAALLRSISARLSPDPARWGGSPVAATVQVRADVASLDSAAGEHSFEIGRGGMMLTMEAFSRPLDERVDFTVQISSGLGRGTLSGQALCRWQTSAKGHPGSSALGLEFVSLSEESRELLRQILAAKSPRAFIPKGL